VRRRVLRNPFPKLLAKRIFIRVFYPGLKRMEKVHCPPNGQSFTVEVEHNLLIQQAEMLEEKHPECEWRMVEVGPHTFNFVGEKKSVEAA
jgi:hypothetical protein